MTEHESTRQLRKWGFEVISEPDAGTTSIWAHWDPADQRAIILYEDGRWWVSQPSHDGPNGRGTASLTAYLRGATR